MAELRRDERGIWVGASAAEVDYPAEASEEGFGVEERSFWHAHRDAVIRRVVRRHPFRGVFADVGGGNGRHAAALMRDFPDRRFVLVEPGYPACLRARGLGWHEVFNTAAADCPLESLGVGGIGLFDVLEHVADDAAFLADLRERALPELRVYVTVPAWAWLWSDVDDYSGHHRRYTPASLRAVAEGSGYRAELCGCFFAWLPAASFLWRSLPYRLGRRRSRAEIAAAALRDHEPGPWARRLLDAAGGWELARFERGGSVPVGASCIAVLQAA